MLWRVRRRLRRLRTCCLCGAALLLAGAYCSSVFRTAPPLMGDGLCDPPGRCAHGTCDAAGDCVCAAGYTGSRCSFLSFARTLFYTQVKVMVDQKMDMQCKASPPNTTVMARRNPVVLIPPMEGSWLESKFDRFMEQPDLSCRRSRSYWKQFWIPELLLFKGDDAACWAAGASLGYDERVHGYTYPRGAQYRVNMTVASMCLPIGLDGKSDASGHRAAFCAYECICKRLEALGYTQNRDLLAAPFDWRLGPQNWVKTRPAGDDGATAAGEEEQGATPQWGYFAHLKATIEHAHDTALARAAASAATPAPGGENTVHPDDDNRVSGDGRVMLIGFSLSCPMIRHFLAEYVTPEWRRTHVAGFFSFSGVPPPISGACIHTCMLQYHDYPKTFQGTHFAVTVFLHTFSFVSSLWKL